GSSAAPLTLTPRTGGDHLVKATYSCPLLLVRVLERSEEAGDAPSYHVEAPIHIVLVIVSWRNQHACTASHRLFLCAPVDKYGCRRTDQRTGAWHHHRV